MTQPKAQVVYRKLAELKELPGNPRIIKKDQFEKLKQSIKDNADYFEARPIILSDRTGELVILAGNQRYKAAKAIGMAEAPTILLPNLTEEREKEIIIRDNVENGDWDWDELANTWDAARLTDWGVQMPDWASEAGAEIIEDEAPEPETDKPAKSKLGEIYQLGDHRLMVGDATNAQMMSALMDGAKADLYLTDPPYNVDYTDGHKNERKILNDHFETDKECGEKLWLPAFTNARENSKDCCSVYCFMPQGGTHMMMMMMMMMAGWNVKHELIWKKQSIVLNRADYNYQHEPFMYGWNKTHKFYGKGEFKNTSVWEIERPTKSKEHPTMKPIRLLTEVLLNASQEGDIVLDNFGGSGSTLIACEQLNRRCYMMELDPHYADVIIERWEKFTGEKAVRIKAAE